ncbi:MAG: hypothetical protein K8S54_00625 [Spirochaetia bacterium]|nr:hypothetical protein [Spirochaetia bacterium]
MKDSDSQGKLDGVSKLRERLNDGLNPDDLNYSVKREKRMGSKLMEIPIHLRVLDSDDITILLECLVTFKASKEM